MLCNMPIFPPLLGVYTIRSPNQCSVALFIRASSGIRWNTGTFRVEVWDSHLEMCCSLFSCHLLDFILQNLSHLSCLLGNEKQIYTEIRKGKKDSSTYQLQVIVTTCVYIQLLSRVWHFATLRTVACQVPLSIGFFRQEYWNELPCSPPQDLPDSGIEPVSPALQADFLLAAPLGKIIT